MKRDIRRSHKHQTGTPSPQLSPPPPPQMYLAAVSVKVAGERLHGKRSRASWVESCGRIFSTSVCPTETGCFFFLFFLVFFSASIHLEASHAWGELRRSSNGER